MGKFDSTKTRVEPVFTELVGRDPSGMTWLAELLSLPDSGEVTPTRPTFADLGGLESAAFGKREKKLPAPRSLLRWLLTHAAAQCNSCWDVSQGTIDKRRALLERRDRMILSEALRELERSVISEKVWYVFEGPTQPDVYLQTSELIVVIEGKRTEPGPTICTSWMPIRHQMLRHIDGAIEIAGSRQVVGFFIVEGIETEGKIELPQVWSHAVRETISQVALDESLPHRSKKQRQQIANAFIGATTWQHVCRKFNIVLPHENQTERGAGQSGQLSADL